MVSIAVFSNEKKNFYAAREKWLLVHNEEKSADHDKTTQICAPGGCR